MRLKDNNGKITFIRFYREFTTDDNGYAILNNISSCYGIYVMATNAKGEYAAGGNNNLQVRILILSGIYAD